MVEYMLYLIEQNSQTKNSGVDNKAQNPGGWRAKPP